MGAITRRFRAEHGLVRRAAACLDRIADRIEADLSFDLGAVCDLLRYCEVFVDDAHQRCEEEVLFRALQRRTNMAERIGELLREHVGERIAIGQLRRGLAAAVCGERSAWLRFAEELREYARQQLEHSLKEVEVLLPLADDLLDESTQADLDLRCRAIERELGLERHEHLLPRIEEIARQCGSILPQPSLGAG